MNDLITNTLSGMGPVGAVIAALLLAISALVTVIVYQNRSITKLNNERKAENAALIKLIENTNTAITRSSESDGDFKDIIQELSEVIKAQAATFTLLLQRVDFYHESNTERLKGLQQAFTSEAEALRVSTGILTDVRNSNIALMTLLNDVKAKLESALMRRGR